MYTKALHGRWCSYVHFTGRKLEDWAAQEADSRWGRVCQPLPRGHSRDQHPWKEGRREKLNGDWSQLRSHLTSWGALTWTVLQLVQVGGGETELCNHCVDQTMDMSMNLGEAVFFSQSHP